jgi:hypothetical protein
VKYCSIEMGLVLEIFDQTSSQRLFDLVVETYSEDCRIGEPFPHISFEKAKEEGSGIGTV